MLQAVENRVYEIISEFNGVLAERRPKPVRDREVAAEAGAA